MRKLLLLGMAAGLVLCGAVSAPATIIWGYETWSDVTPADGQVDEWTPGYNLSFVPDNSSFPGESLGVATIGSENPDWGKVWYGSGVSSASIIGQYHYLYVETYDIQGDMKVWLGTDADHFDASANCILGNPGDPNVIYNPGPYVFDIASWAPAAPHDNTVVQMIGEGGTGQGFSVRRIFLTDNLADTGFEAVPEPKTTAMMMGAGLILTLVRKARKK